MATLSTLPRRTAARFDAPQPLRLWHLTSLDAPTVAIVWTLAFAWAAHIRLPLWLPAVVGLCGWSFYIADRLLDARTARTPLRPRHHFHWKHRHVFSLLALASALSALGLVLHCMPQAARVRNSVLAAAALMYFGSVHLPWRPALPALSLPRLPKELLVGAIFTLTCFVPTLARLTAHRAVFSLPIFVFAALAWLNCHAIESWESSALIERGAIRRFAILLAALALPAAVVAAALGRLRFGLLLATAALSAILLALLDRYRHRLTPTTLRAAADLVLLTPVALLLLP